MLGFVRKSSAKTLHFLLAPLHFFLERGESTCVWHMNIYGKKHKSTWLVIPLQTQHPQNLMLQSIIFPIISWPSLGSKYPHHQTHPCKKNLGKERDEQLRPTPEGKTVRRNIEFQSQNGTILLFELFSLTSVYTS